MQQKETLSAYMDGQAVEADFAETVLNSPELKQTWARYHTIRNVMQGEEILLGDNFSAKMEALLENETIEPVETQVTDKATQKRGLVVKLKRWGMPLMQAGIAASVCLVALVGVNMMNSADEVAQTEPALQTVPFSNAVQAVSYNAPTQSVVSPERLEQQQRHLEALLQNYEIQRRTNTTGLTEEEKVKAQTSSTAKETQPKK